MKSPLPIALAAFALPFLLLAGCNSVGTKVDATWASGDLSRLQAKKVMVVAATPDGALRRRVEDAMKAQVIHADAIQSYSLITDPQELKDRARLSATLKAAGVDAVIVMRLVSDRTEILSTPTGPYPESYRSFGGYYTRDLALSPFYYDSTHISTARILQIETNIYEVATGSLVWSSATSTRNATDVQQLIDEAAAAVRREVARTRA